MTKCWLCGKEFKGEGYPSILGMACLECGPEQPWGPTPQEMLEVLKKFAEENDADDKREPELSDPRYIEDFIEEDYES